MMDPLAIPSDKAPQLGRVGDEFLAAIYGVATRRHPTNLDALAELGHVYTRLGRYQDGLEVDRQLVEHEPLDSTHRYNLACSQALLGFKEEAISTLETALELGYDDLNHLHEDEDLAALRGHPRYEALLVRISAGGAADDLG